jgi:hypothetical protein
MIEGSCHRGAVRWSLAETPESATACNCTACRRYGVLWAYDYEGHRIKVSGPTKAYVRGEFHFCPEWDAWPIGEERGSMSKAAAASPSISGLRSRRLLPASSSIISTGS